jgi:hypothetical protein
MKNFNIKIYIEKFNIIKKNFFKLIENNNKFRFKNLSFFK